MTPESLKQQLSQQYKLVCFEDFAKLTEHTGILYTVFQQCYQSEYQPQQRLIFYTQHRLSLNQLCHLQLAATLTDISNYFIMVCSPHDLTDDLIIANRRHGNDQTVIECKIVDVNSEEFLSTEFVSLDTLCPLPWMHLVVTNLGEIGPCCYSSEILGHITQHQMQDVFHSKSMQQIRWQMTQGEKPKSCELCFKQEAHNQRSPRHHMLGLYQKQLLSTYIVDPKIRSLDLKLGNTCNFKCKICNKDFSSQFASEELKHATTDQKIVEIRRAIDLGKWYDNNENFLDQLEPIWSDLINIDILGGEPFLLKNLPEFLDHAVDSEHAKHIRLHFNTNGSIFPEKLIDNLNKFQSVDIAISIDNIGQQFEIERGGNWDNIEHNVHQFLSLPQTKFRSYIYCTVNIQNVLDLDELYQWADHIGIDVVLSWLHAPLYFSIDNLTPKGKDLVVSKYQDSTRPSLKLIANKVLNSPGSDGTEFVAAMRRFDQRRQQDFLLTHKTIAIAMGFVV